MNVLEHAVVGRPAAIRGSQMSALVIPPSSPVVFEPLISAVDAGQLLNLHPVTILRWAREGRIPHRRLGRRVVFRVSELNSWLTIFETEVSHAA
ncbi:helix-turn-helix domain-containing protein [Tunturiibacter gelidiferens]|uniref:helix-turn-helix domain-containing protein n=1 Tax=Tunturiibacter gelidiferens TaxID=3069689 RepID=UPI00334212D6